MAFPSIRDVIITNGTTASATPSINLPATVSAGDILFVFFRVAVAGAVGWPDATWNEIIDASDDAADDQNAAAWKVAVGTEGGSTITLSCTSGKFAAVAYSIQNAAGGTLVPQLSTVATGTTPNQPDATTCTPTTPAGINTSDYLWLTFFGMAGEATGITNYPTNYTLGQSGFANSGTGGAATTNCIVCAAGRQNAATSEDAGAWTIAGTLAQWSAWTIAFHPFKTINFETGDFTECANRIGDGTIVTGPVQKGNYAARLGPDVSSNGGVVEFLTGLSLSQIGIRKWIYVDVLPGGADPRIWGSTQFYDGTNSFIVNINSAGKQVAEGPVALTGTTTGTYTLQPQTWYERTVVLDVAAGGIYKVWIRSRDEWVAGTAATLDISVTHASASANIVSIASRNGINTVASFYIDDIVITNYVNPVPPTTPLQTIPDAKSYEIEKIPAFKYTVTSLTLAVNLLQTTLAPIPELPKNQNDWPNPAPIRSQLLVTTNTRPVQDGTPPLVPVEFRNPDLRKEQNKGFTRSGPHYYQLPDGKLLSSILPLPRSLPGLTWVSNSQQNTLARAFYQTDWPVPNPKFKPPYTWINNNISDTLAPVASPFSQTDWPNPTRITSQLTVSINSRPTNDDKIAFNQLDWPNPAPAKLIAKSFSFSKQLEPPPEPPFVPVDYPNPRYKGQQNKGSTSPRPFYYTEPVFVNSSCPITLGIGAPGDITCLVLTGLEANPTSSFSTGSQWIQINPQIRKPVTQTWLQTRQFFYTDQGIVGKQYDTLPLRKRANLVGFINPRPFYFIQPTAIPLNQGIAWPNPAPKRKYNPSWLDYYLLDSTSVIVTAPSKYQYDVLIPGKVPVRSYIGWIDYRIFDTNVPAQPTQNIWNNPVRRRFQTQTWLQNSLTSSVVGLPPIGEDIFELPRIAKKQAITWLQTSNSLTAPIPVGASEFTNPRIATRLGLSYIQNRPFFYEEPLFNTVPVLDVPVVVKRVQEGFIFNAQIQETTPILFTDYPNPILPNKLAESWIQNLLQSTLTPTPGETPFYQTDYPNPLLGKVGSGWTWSRPQYYTDSIAFRQNDWPNPQYGKRNNPVLEVPRFFFIEQPISPFLQFNFPNPILKNKIALTFINDILRFTLNPFPVGQSVYNNPTIGVRNRELLTFIASQNPNLAELPIIRNTDFPVPLRVAVYNRGFTDNPLAVITIIPGTQPFNQSEWPLFLRIKRNRVDYNQNKPIVLPDIVGRIICLDADATEYDLEATIDGFDLDAQETDYDLEAGGQDCE